MAVILDDQSAKNGMTSCENCSEATFVKMNSEVLENGHFHVSLFLVTAILDRSAANV